MKMRMNDVLSGIKSVVEEDVVPVVFDVESTAYFFIEASISSRTSSGTSIRSG